MRQESFSRISKAKAVIPGAICGDIIGSLYEWHRTKNYNFKLCTKFSRFTDDTVCSIAVADAITSDIDFTRSLQKWCQMAKLPDEMKSVIAKVDEEIESRYGRE